jgi:hypothetical protein
MSICHSPSCYCKINLNAPNNIGIEKEHLKQHQSKIIIIKKKTIDIQITLWHVLGSWINQRRQSIAIYCQSSDDLAILHNASIIPGQLATGPLPSL